MIVDQDEQVISVTSSAWPVRDTDVTPGLSVEEAEDVLVGKIVAGQPVNVTLGPTLVVYPEADGRLVYLVYVAFGRGRMSRIQPGLHYYRAVRWSSESTTRSCIIALLRAVTG